jgi:hypothetical protein
LVPVLYQIPSLDGKAPPEPPELDDEHATNSAHSPAPIAALAAAFRTHQSFNMDVPFRESCTRPSLDDEEYADLRGIDRERLGARFQRR